MSMGDNQDYLRPDNITQMPEPGRKRPISKRY